MLMPYQRVFFPLWMGAGVKTRVPAGAKSLRRALGGEAIEIVVSDAANLERTDGVKAKPELLETLGRAAQTLEGFKHVALLGGDCSSDFVLLAASTVRYGDDLAVIWLDTHADLNTDASSPSGHHHGMVLRAALGDCDADFQKLLPRALSPRQVFFGGVREFDDAEKEYVHEHGIPVFSPDALRSDPGGTARAVRDAGFTKAHVHLDLDVLDDKEFRSTGFSSEGGLFIAELEMVIREIKTQLEVVSFAVTEYAPAQDGDDLETVTRLVHSLEGTV
jgi:arginase